MGKPVEIYFHVGLGKVASTFLQKRFFPKLRGIRYIPGRKYQVSKKLIQKQGVGKVLVSREFDRQFDREVTWFTETYPETRIIILFRKHSEWIASQYRRHVKNGWLRTFEEFVDLDHNRGFWDQQDLLFFPKLEHIGRCSTKKPLVLFHEELLEDPLGFLDRIARYLRTDYPRERINLRPVHRSFSDKQLLVFRWIGRRLRLSMPEGHKNKVLHWVTFRPVWLLYHLLLYLAAVVPDRLVKHQLIDPEYLDRIDAAFQEDWRKVKAFAAENNPQAG